MKNQEIFIIHSVNRIAFNGGDVQKLQSFIAADNIYMKLSSKCNAKA